MQYSRTPTNIHGWISNGLQKKIIEIPLICSSHGRSRMLADARGWIFNDFQNKFHEIQLICNTHGRPRTHTKHLSSHAILKMHPKLVAILRAG